MMRARCALLVAVAIAVACSPYPGPSAQSPPPLTATESRIIESLGTLGIAAMPAEHGFGRSASIWSRIDADSAFYVNTDPVGTDGAAVSVLLQREIAGVTVERVEYPAVGVRDRFRCGELIVETGGDVPPGFDDFDVFLARFIAVLDC